MRLQVYLLEAALAATGWAGTFGKVVVIGGHAADLALDEGRGVLYVANFSANRIEVVRTQDLALQSSMNVAPQPSALALSPDGRYLVAAHFGNFQAPNSPGNVLTVIDLDSGGKQTFALGAPPLGLAFGIDSRALIVTSSDFLLFDPVSGATQTVGTVEGVTAKTLPAPPANFPPQIVAASLAASSDGLAIYGLADTIRFRYDVLQRAVFPLGYTASPPLGPRVVSVARDGSRYAAGWALFDSSGTLLAQFVNPSGQLQVGSHALDSARGILYAQIPEGAPAPGGAPQSGGSSPAPAAQAPTLMIADADNLTVRERLSLPENLAGRSVLSSDGAMMYSISDSGVAVLPVGALAQAPRLSVSREDVVFRGNFCDRRVATEEISITDPSGAGADFALSASIPGIRLSPASGTTPATVRISIDPNAFQNRTGTLSASIQVRSSRAVNLPPPVRVLINNREPDQRGTIVNVPGKLVDILADPARDRFFVLRQDTNQVLVFDGSTNTQTAALRTGATPTQMALTFDRRHLLIGNENSQIANVYDLETLEQLPPILMPRGHYPHSLACSGRTCLAAVRSASSAEHKIDRIDLWSRSGVELPSLGPWQNNVHLNTVLVASGNGASILAAQADGSVLLYNATADTFTVWRKDFNELGGAYAASSQDLFAVDNYLLNGSLVAVHRLDGAPGSSSGFAFVEQSAFRTTAVNAAAPGVIARVELATRETLRPTRMAEAPCLGETGSAFTRTLALLARRNAIVSLTTSGFTVLPWEYAASVPAPRIDGVVNAADASGAVAPGSLVTLWGRHLSPVNIATSEMPLPTALGESCLTVNGALAPMLFVSPAQINAQLPYQIEGNVTLVLRTPGGVSDNFNLTIAPAAPAVFRAQVSDETVPVIVRVRNGLLATLANPLHRGDTIVIFAAGMGRTWPAVEAGAPAPLAPLAEVAIPPQLELGGVPLPVLFAGLTPGYAGMYQINARVPDWVPVGMSVPLTVRQGGGATSVEVRVVE